MALPSTATAADVLLLSLEVEAAAARNAELSLYVDRLHSTLHASSIEPYPLSEALITGQPPRSTPSFACASTQTELFSSTDVRRAVVNLDDALFDIADMLSCLHPSAPLDTSPRHIQGPPSVLQLSEICLSQVRRLREAWKVKSEGSNRLTEELQHELMKRAEENERLQATIAELRVLVADKNQVIESLAQHQRELSGTNAVLHAKCVDLDAAVKEGERRFARAEEQVDNMRADHGALTLENEKLKRALDSLRQDWVKQPSPPSFLKPPSPPPQ